MTFGYEFEGPPEEPGPWQRSPEELRQMGLDAITGDLNELFMRFRVPRNYPAFGVTFWREPLWGPPREVVFAAHKLVSDDPPDILREQFAIIIYNSVPRDLHTGPTKDERGVPRYTNKGPGRLLTWPRVRGTTIYPSVDYRAHHGETTERPWHHTEDRSTFCVYEIGSFRSLDFAGARSIGPDEEPVVIDGEIRIVPRVRDPGSSSNRIRKFGVYLGLIEER